MSYETIKEIQGHTFVRVERTNHALGQLHPQDEQDCLVFYRKDGKIFEFSHLQICCENVSIEDICGNLEDLVDVPILVAEERTSDNHETGSNYSETWTFYTFRTINGTVDVRWYGESNGYYSESVGFYEVK